MKEKTSQTKNPFASFGRWCVDTGKWLVDIKDWKMLFRSIPSIVVGLFLVSILGMNLLANKVLLTGLQLGGWYWMKVSWGLLLSAIPFLICDIVTKTYGAKATIKLNILGLLVSLGMTLVFLAVSYMPAWSGSGFTGNFTYNNITGADDLTYGPVYQLIDGVYKEVAVDYSGFGTGGVMRASWYVTLASSIAFIISGIVNALVNAGVGKLFRKNPDSRVAFMTRSYSSTLIGQFVDNFLFIFLAFGIFANIASGWNNDVCVTNLTAGLGAGLIGAVVELLMEVVISPLGYRICRKWKKESVGKDYLDYCKEMELKEDIGRFEFKEETTEEK